MKKHYILFIACCFAALSAWADTSITETYVTNPYSGAQTSRVSYNGRYTEWYFRNARSGGKNDKLNDDTKGFWLSRTANSCYLESTFEGGVKHVAFKWKQFSTGDNGFKFVLNIITKVGSAAAVTQQSYSFDGDADHTNTDQSYSQTVAIKDNNVKLTIQNSSTQSDGSTVGGRLIIGPVTITPYLLYTQKDITIGSKQQGYYNAELIDNTDSEGSISYSSGNESVALVDAESGVVTPVSAGNVVITATWSEGASTTYTLHVVDGIIAENFSKVSQTSQTPDATTWHGDLFDWRGHCLRRGTDDTIGLAPRIQATAFRRLSDVGSYIHTRSVVEGGVKHVAFDWRQWASGTSPLAMNLYYSADDENWGDAVATQSVDAVGAAEPHTFDYDVDNGAIGNAYMKLVFTSGAGHAVMGAMKITPWLLYTTKEATLDTRGSGALTYTNPDLIDNTGSTVTYSIENYGGIPEEKISIAADGTVTVADRYQTGDITVQAKWSEVTTTYTLHVVGKAETEVSYEVTEVYKTFGDAIFFNPLTITHAGSNPTFSSTQENVATINEFGNVTIVGAGTTTIKATFAETDTYKGAEVSYTLIVRPIVRLMGINDDWTTGLTLTMAADGNTASYTLENQEGADNKYIDFKLQVAGEWRSTDYTFNRDYPEASNITSNNDKNMKVRIDFDGAYTFTWTYENNALAITFPAIPAVEYYIAGTFTNWEENKITMNTADEGATWTAAASLAANAEENLKVVRIQGPYKVLYGLANWAQMTSSNCTDWVIGGGNETIGIKANDAGSYTFTFVPTGLTLSVQYPGSATAVDNVEPSSKATKRLENGMLIIEKNGVRYNVLGAKL